MSMKISRISLKGESHVGTIVFVALFLVIMVGIVYWIVTKNTAPKDSENKAENRYVTSSKEVEITPPKEVTLDLSTEFARQYQTVLSAELKKPANFGGHYRMALVGCGSACGTHKLLDKNTGKVYDTPVSEDLLLYASVDFSVNSPDLILRYADGRSEIYRFNGTEFVVQ